MDSLLDFSLSTFETLLFIILTGISAVVAFLGWLWYAGLDRKTQKFDEQLQSDIEEDPAFRGIREAAYPEFIVTSDTRLSKFIGRVKKLLGFRTQKPYKIIPVDDGVLEPRKIEFIRQRVRRIPGRNILGDELVGAIRNYYAYQLALKKEGIGSGIVEHFESNLQEYEHSQKIVDLSKSSNYDKVVLTQNPSTDSDKDALNDVFLPLVRAAEHHCVRRADGLEMQREEIEHCRRVLKLTLFLLWTNHMKGIRVSEELTEDDCLSKYREDIRDADNWGYWMLPAEPCDEGEFERLRHLAWSINRIVEEYWDEESYSELYPHGDSIRKFDYVEAPFVIFQKDEQEFRGGGPSGQS